MPASTTQALGLIDTWPVPHAAAAVVTVDSIINHGPADRRFGLASLTKPMTAWAVLVGVEEGIVDLDHPIDPSIGVPDGVTLRHLLAHAAGFPFEGERVVSAPERRRIYSNTGFERAAATLAAAAAMPFAEYLRLAVFDPLGMTDTALEGSPAWGVRSTVADTASFVHETLWPQLLAHSTHGDAISPQYAELAGIVPGVGRFDPCPWGLGVEIRGAKSPHWMGRDNSTRAYGHFGGSGTLMWADPDAGIGAVALTDRPYTEWSDDALRLWPALADALLAEARSRQ